MELYDALKSGVKPEDLLKSFQQDLDAAKKRIIQEEEKEKQERKKRYIEDCRDDLTLAIVDYMDAIFGDLDMDEIDEEIETIKKLLINFEKEMDKWTLFDRNIKKIFSNNDGNKTIKINTKNDNEIINSFIQELEKKRGLD